MKILVAMSGGVDSSVAAALLAREGHEVVGVFMRLGAPGEALDDGSRLHHRGCCSIGDADDARRVAARLGVAFYVANFRGDFDRIIDYFADEYAAGRTPNPCVRCNDWLKFGRLHDTARSIGADAVASGHYARILGGRLARAADPAKDQSYVLFGLPRDRLARTLFPIGDLPKHEVRRLARDLGLGVASKPDSQEICFVPDDDYARIVEARRPGLARPGRILDEEGRALGGHAGHHRFTIGQRRGLGLALPLPLYVLRKEAASNTIVVGERRRLATRACTAAEANWHIDPPSPPSPPSPPIPCLAKFRSNSPAVPAVATLLPEDQPGTSRPTPSGRTGRFRVEFDDPQEGLAPGQAIVLYDDEGLVMGGGWIASTEPVNRPPCEV